MFRVSERHELPFADVRYIFYLTGIIHSYPKCFDRYLSAEWQSGRVFIDVITKISFQDLKTTKYYSKKEYNFLVLVVTDIRMHKLI